MRILSLLVFVSTLLLVSPTWADSNPVVVLKTSMGDIEVELYPDKAPKTVANFLRYVDEGYYAGTIFHRIIRDFMVQGGGFDKNLTKKSTYEPIVNEAFNGLTNDKGTIAMARTSVIDSATSQFFINLKDNGFLNHRNKSAQGFGYAVFGKVIQGMDVVMAMGNALTWSKDGMDDVPVKTITILSAQRK